MAVDPGADGEGLGLGRQLVDNLIMQGLRDDQARLGGADLPGMAENPACR